MASKGTRRNVTGARKPSGRLRQEPPQDPRFPTMWRRIKDHGMALGVHPYVGTVLGRLALMGKLSDHQAQAGFRFAEIVGAYDRLCSGARPYTAASPAYQRGFGAGGLSGHDDAALERNERAARKARKRYDKVIRCLPGAAAESLLVDVCIRNEEPGEARHHDVAQLLGAVAVRLGISDGTAPRVLSAAGQKPSPKRARLCADLAEALLRAIEEDFALAGAVAEEFDLDRGDPAGESCGIVVSGDVIDPASGAALRPYRHAAAVRRGDFLAAEIDAALMKLAAARGWRERS
jgi:hypothetical protein